MAKENPQKEVIDNRLSATALTLVPALKRCLESQLVPMVHGSPGIGKSSILRMLADLANLEFIDCRLSTYDPTDLNGFPCIDKESGRSYYAPPRNFPVKGDEIPKGKRGWLIMLDEINSASIAVQAAAYKLVLDREIGEFELHPQVYMACAGNLATDGAIVNRMGTAMQSRLIHFILKSDVNGWLEWADTVGDVDHRVLAYIRFSGALNMFDPNKQVDNTFPCERTWEFVSKLIKNEATITLDKDLLLLGGAVGFGQAEEFISFCEVYDHLPDLEEIEKDPEGHPVPIKPDVLFALTSAISKRVDKNNIGNLIKFIKRLQIEFQVISLHSAIHRSPDLLHNPEVSQWSIDQSRRMVAAQQTAAAA